MELKCGHCPEPIKQTDQYRTLVSGQHFHEECLVRIIAGSVAHQSHKCSCFGGAVDDSGPEAGLTVREDARRAAVHFWTALNKSLQRHLLN